MKDLWEIHEVQSNFFAFLDQKERVHAMILDKFYYILLYYNYPHPENLFTKSNSTYLENLYIRLQLV